MPIYAYRCTSCGHAKDVLQKISDPALTVCPACSASTFAKQLTAAGFQLKGSGWYATDFKGGGAKPSEGEKAKTESDKSTQPATTDAAKPDPGKSVGDSGAGGKPDGTSPKASAAGR
jgi:putative FmdB family regulatory protein